MDARNYVASNGDLHHHDHRHLSDSMLIQGVRNKRHLNDSNTMTKTNSYPQQKCLVYEYMGQTFYTPYSSPFAPSMCFKLDLFMTGSISVGNNNIDCTSNSLFTSLLKLGVYIILATTPHSFTLPIWWITLAVISTIIVTFCSQPRNQSNYFI